MDSEEDIINLQKSFFGDEDENGNLNDFSIQPDKTELIDIEDDIKDDDAPLIDPNIEIVSDIIKKIYSLIFCDSITEHGKLCLNAILPEQYNKGMSLKEYRMTVGSNHLGSINSCLSIGLYNRIAELLKKDGYNSIDDDQIDWVILKTMGDKKYKVEGDTKFAIARNTTLDCFTGNGSSHKRGYYLLIAVKLDDSVPMKETRITHMYIGIINVKYVCNIRSEGKSDRSSIKIKTSLSHRLFNIYGTAKVSSKSEYVKFNLDPVGSSTNEGFFSNDVE